ncbi:MAG: OsmC family protein [Pseudomonadota bacterium]
MSDSVTIRQALDRACRTVTLRPERGQRTYRSVATIGNGTQCHVEEGDRSLTLDVVKALGGADAGPTPSMVLRAALSGCVAIGVKQFAAWRDIQVDGVEVVLETDIDARGQLGVRDDIAPGFLGIRLAISIRTSAPQAEIEDVVAASLRCSPLMDVFQNPQAIEHKVSILETDTA